MTGSGAATVPEGLPGLYYLVFLSGLEVVAEDNRGVAREPQEGSTVVGI